MAPLLCPRLGWYSWVRRLSLSRPRCSMHYLPRTWLTGGVSMFVVRWLLPRRQAKQTGFEWAVTHLLSPADTVTVSSVALLAFVLWCAPLVSMHAVAKEKSRERERDRRNWSLVRPLCTLNVGRSKKNIKWSKTHRCGTGLPEGPGLHIGPFQRAIVTLLGAEHVSEIRCFVGYIVRKKGS
ncbi:hypothetical protein F5Y01DRAFT_268797 [Xylaria sp. FL0043]|nr:hypothetical protein F5Y01DRAFT_268797 [Xylaria sp. FL0043]